MQSGFSLTPEEHERRDALVLAAISGIDPLYAVAFLLTFIEDIIEGEADLTQHELLKRYVMISVKEKFKPED
jgi:hypothetical protein